MRPPAANRMPHRRRSGDHYVPALPDVALLDLRAGQHYFSVSSVVSRRLQRAQQLACARASTLLRTCPRYFLGYELTHTTEVFVDIEEASGGGLSDGLGLAGFVNLDVVRNPHSAKEPYLARAMIRQIIPLSHKTAEAERGTFALATSVPSAAWSCAPANSARPISSI